MPPRAARKEAHPNAAAILLAAEAMLQSGIEFADRLTPFCAFSRPVRGKPARETAALQTRPIVVPIDFRTGARVRRSQAASISATQVVGEPARKCGIRGDPASKAEREASLTTGTPSACDM